MKSALPALTLTLTLKVIQGGDDDFGRPFIRFAAGDGDSVIYLESRAQVGWFMKFFDRDMQFKVLVEETPASASLLTDGEKR